MDTIRSRPAPSVPPLAAGRSLAGRPPAARDEPADAGARDVGARLREHGASPELVERVLRRLLERGARGTHAIDAAARALGAAFPILPSPRRPRGAARPHGFVFVGPTGAGKTASLAKLGRRLRDAGMRVAFASLDGVGASALLRAGNVEADVDRTEIELVPVRGIGDLRRAWRGVRPDVLLIDTPGLSPRDAAGRDELVREIERLAETTPLDVYLVLSAAQSRSALALALQAFARPAPTACVVTKLDETEQPVAVLEELARHALPLAFLCDGQDVRAHLVRPSPDRLADLCLRGRLV